MPTWLVVVAWLGVGLGVASALIVALDIVAGHRQRMAVMNLVWPLTALYSGLLGLWAYFTIGRRAARPPAQAHDAGPASSTGEHALTRESALATTHCGSGCCLGDLLAETLVIFVPLSLFGQRIFGTWALDFVLAFLIGIAFQYFTIKPMRNLSTREALTAAVKADTASLCAWQIGMYGWMGLATFVIFGRELPKNGGVFWFMMQVAMLVGFLTSWPVNAWLVKRGIKEAM